MSTEPTDSNTRESSVTKDGGRVHPFWRFLYLLVSPVNGWKRIKNARYTPQFLAGHLFFPLLALMTLCRFAGMFYNSDETLSRTLQMAVCLFVAGFAGYYAVVALGRTFLPPEAQQKIDTNFGRVYVMVNLSVLALAMTIFELVPGIGVLFLVVPIYAAYLMVKGVKLLRIPDSEQKPAAVLLTLLLLAVPSLIYMVLEWMMPVPQEVTLPAR